MIIFDLDTLADDSHRRHFITPTCSECKCELGSDIEYDLGWHCMYPCDNVTRKEDWKPDYDSYNAACVDDNPIEKTLTILDLVSTYLSPVEFWTGRSEVSREQTHQWILKNTGLQCSIHTVNMRSSVDNRPSWQIKEEWLIANLSNNRNIEMVFESDPESIEMYRRYGIYVFDCRQV